LNSETYVLYLLKHYNRIRSEARFLEMEAQDQETYDGVQFDGTIQVVVRQFNQRFTGKHAEELKRAAEILRHELHMIDTALNMLPDRERRVLTDIYINGISWTNAAMKYYISETCIARYRQRAAKKIGAMLDRPSGGLFSLLLHSGKKEKPRHPNGQKRGGPSVGETYERGKKAHRAVGEDGVL